ncbi:MAG TPA: hypothetical protein VLQ45_17965, partial [Thermoanaerobaculia bacterium]|nr:hypothetical protein [Thermoanaerobaculia bacterium]
GDDSPETQRRLREALRRNRYIPDYLLGWRSLPDDLPISPRPGREEEAALYAGGAMDPGGSAPGALEWLDFWVPMLREPAKAVEARVEKTAKKKKRR